MSDPKATGIILNWRRPGNIPAIVDSMLAEPWITSVIVWDNSGKLELERDSVQVIRSPQNLFTLGRFLAAQQAATPLIYTQDDDCVVTNKQRLYDAHRATGRLCCYLDHGHIEYSRRHYHHGGRAYETLLGWGSVFRREWVDEALCRFDAQWATGETEELLKRKADRAFAILLEQEHIEYPVTVCHLPGATGDSALYHMTDHWKLSKEIGKRCREILDG